MSDFQRESVTSEPYLSSPFSFLGLQPTHLGEWEEAPVHSPQSCRKKMDSTSWNQESEWPGCRAGGQLQDPPEGLSLGFGELTVAINLAEI